MDNTTLLIVIVVTVFGFIIGGLLMLTHNKKFKLPDDWENKKKPEWDEDD